MCFYRAKCAALLRHWGAGAGAVSTTVKLKATAQPVQYQCTSSLLRYTVALCSTAVLHLELFCYIEVGYYPGRGILLFQNLSNNMCYSGGGILLFQNLSNNMCYSGGGILLFQNLSNNMCYSGGGILLFQNLSNNMCYSGGGILLFQNLSNNMCYSGGGILLFQNLSNNMFIGNCHVLNEQ